MDGVATVFVTRSGHEVFQRRLKVIPDVGSIVLQGVRPVNYVVLEVRHNIGKESDGSGHVVTVVVDPQKQ